MSSSPLVTEAEAVRRFIADDEKAGSEALAAFARRHAKAAKYRNGALAIGASLPDVDDPVVLNDLRRRMIEVLDGILDVVTRRCARYCCAGCKKAPVRSL